MKSTTPRLTAGSPLPFHVVEARRGIPVVRVVLASLEENPDCSFPARARMIGARDDQSAVAERDLDLVPESSARDKGLGKQQATGITNSYQAGFHDL